MFYYQKILNLITSNKTISTIFAFVALLNGLLSPIDIQANDDPVSLNNNDVLTVFLDFGFHQQYIRETITFVNYVRDRELAKVHIMMTRHGSGTAGENYVISFIGRDRFEEMNNIITYWSPGTNTSDDTRRGLVNIIRIGLAPYLASTNLVNQISVNIKGNIQVEREPYEDKWNNWVFEIFGGANFNRESSQGRFNSRWGFSADKTSEDWKIRFRPYFNYNERNFFDTEEGTITSKSHRHGYQGDFIKSITQHWSAGLFIRILSSTFHNANFNISATPGIEYSLYPYSEATRKAITVVYRIGIRHNNYIETTIFNKDKEVLGRQSLDISARYQQPWGSYRASITGSHHFHDFTSNQLAFSTRLDLRVRKGLSLSLNGSFNLINDLVSLPAGEMTLEEILLQQRRQATNYQMSGAIGLAYSFGSQFTNVVNTRF